jgi:hypothetical protein
VLLSRDEARFQMVLTPAATLGVKGHRPVVGTRNCKDVLYLFCVLNLISGALHANTLESLQASNRKSEESKTRRMQKAFAQHLRHVGRMYPREKFSRVVLTTDPSAPGTGGRRQARRWRTTRARGLLAARLQPRPQRDRGVLEEAAAAGQPQPAVRHDRDLKEPVRASLCYLQALLEKVLTLINGRRKKSPG